VYGVWIDWNLYDRNLRFDEFNHLNRIIDIIIRISMLQIYIFENNFIITDTEDDLIKVETYVNFNFVI